MTASDSAHNRDSIELIAVGRIGPAHGNQGEAYVEPWTDAPDERFAPGAVLQTDPADHGPLTVRSQRFQGDRLIVGFIGFDDRDAIATLRATQLLIAASDRPPLADPDEFYDSDLVGCAVVSNAGHDLGLVLDVLHLAGAAYLLLKVDGVERMVPFVASIVIDVEIAQRRVVIEPPEGLFEL